MGTKDYKIKVPELLNRLDLKPFSLVRMCDLGVDTAYKAADPDRANEITLDTCWKIYRGLVDRGYPITWDDVVEF